jgi:hypothetical protein
MTLNADNTSASISLPNLTVGTHTFKIEFEYDAAGLLKPLLLVDATKAMDLVEGNNDLVFAESDYTKHDTDGDGIDNVQELVDLSNPFSCVLGVSIIGDCQLGT